MSLTAPQRLVRAALGASLSTFVALGSHILGGGHLPSLAGWVVPLVLSFAVCVQLAGRALSLWRTAVGVVVSQGLFHLLFTLGSGSMVLSGAGHGHHGGETAVTVLDSAAHGVHGGGLMTGSHLVAATVTTFAMYRAEWLLDRGAWIAAWLRTTRIVPAPAMASRPSSTELRTVVPAAVSSRRLSDARCGVLTLRGPPAFSR